MKKFMLVYEIFEDPDCGQEKEVGTCFYDSFGKMDDARMDIEVSIGGYCEMYERRPIDPDDPFSPICYMPI